MSLHITVPHFHLPHLSRRAVVRASGGSAVAVFLLAADTAGYTVPAVALLVGAVAAWQVTDRYWQRRFERFAAAVDENNQAIHLQLAQHERVLADRYDADVADRNARWLALNSARTSAGVR